MTPQGVIDQVNEKLKDGWVPLGGMTVVYSKNRVLDSNASYQTDFNSNDYYQLITFMQAIYKPKAKELL